MKNLFNRFTSAALAMTLVAGLSGITAFAAEDSTLKNGTYEGNIHFYKASDASSLSMCDTIFAHDADITLTDDSANVTFYVAYPIPAFPTQGTDGTIKDVTFTYNDTEYVADYDISSQPVKTFDTTGSLFGITAGESYETEVVNVSLPREAVNDFEDGIAVSAYVNVVMMSTQNFTVKITDLSQTSSDDNTSSDNQATETTTKEVEVSAEIAAPAASYTVTIPESVTLGTLSADIDTAFDYNVEVTAQNLGDGYVEVVTDAAGNLKSGNNSLAFTNSFGTQKTSTDAILNGTFAVKAADVKAAAAGNYTGTVNFNINYYAAK